jgi:hypothetical protein
MHPAKVLVTPWDSTARVFPRTPHARTAPANEEHRPLGPDSGWNSTPISTPRVAKLSRRISALRWEKTWWLNYNVSDVIDVLFEGRIVKSGDRQFALVLEQ